MTGTPGGGRRGFRCRYGFVVVWPTVGLVVTLVLLSGFVVVLHVAGGSVALLLGSRSGLVVVLTGLVVVVLTGLVVVELTGLVVVELTGDCVDVLVGGGAVGDGSAIAVIVMPPVVRTPMAAAAATIARRDRSAVGKRMGSPPRWRTPDRPVFLTLFPCGSTSICCIGAREFSFPPRR
ncbi:hypothetical protein ACQPZF_00460 [Actinosynnema sp. CS-041913]|uniref:hypothetical protein n=1 Tax=Actinosynnema sp. CS-041913 TaxID=3239917 RepID=UPI003D91FB81